MAEFTCTAVAEFISWKANGQQIENGILVNVDVVNVAQNIRMSTLRMMVASTDNATNITCLVISLSSLSSDTSDPALLLVQGRKYTFSNT